MLAHQRDSRLAIPIINVSAVYFKCVYSGILAWANSGIL